jgi:hypothetical protein
MYSDAKLDKAVAYDIVLPKDDRSNYFTCDKLKGTVNAGSNPEVITFTFKPPHVDKNIVNFLILFCKYFLWHRRALRHYRASGSGLNSRLN